MSLLFLLVSCRSNSTTFSSRPRAFFLYTLSRTLAVIALSLSHPVLSIHAYVARVSYNLGTYVTI